MQGAIPAHCYDPLATTNSTRSVPDDYAQYWTSGAPSYFNSTAGAGSYINFFNINDYALGWWNVDQGQKPDAGTTPAYHYVTPSGTNPSGFYKQIGSTEYNLYFPTNTYELFAYGVPSWSFALGAQPNVGGAFKTASQVELDIAPFNYLNTHKYHSAEFRSDNMSRANFWNAVITQMRIPH